MIINPTIDQLLPFAMYIIAIVILYLNSQKLASIKGVRDSLMPVLKEAKNLAELKKINGVTSSVYYTYFAIILIIFAMIYRYLTLSNFLEELRTLTNANNIEAIKLLLQLY